MTVSFIILLCLMLCCKAYQRISSIGASVPRSTLPSRFDLYYSRLVLNVKMIRRLTSLCAQNNPSDIAVSVNIHRKSKSKDHQGNEATVTVPSQFIQQEWTYDRLIQQLRMVRNRRELIQLWEFILMQKNLSVSSWFVHELMKTALHFDEYQFAILVFERFHDFPHSSHYHRNEQQQYSRYRFFDKTIVKQVNISNPLGSEVFKPHPHLVTTAIKAYGRARNFELAKGLVDWIEQDYHISPDIHMMSALLYVMAKTRQVKEVERIFWQEIPQRGLTHNVVTVNSLMYLYARLKRPQDALKVYEMMKREGLQCTIVTYGILVKALMLSGDPLLHKVAKDVVMSLPSMNLQPTVEIFNQMLEYYAAINNADGAQEVYSMMQKCDPPVSMNSVSYGHMIYCLASDHKPQVALALFQQLRQKNQNKVNENSVANQLPINKRKKWQTKINAANAKVADNNYVAGNEHAYMGVLKALASLRDGVGAVRILSEMMDQQVRVDQNHVATALFACLVSNQLSVAETLIHAFIQHAQEAPDITICNLWLRIYWQQGKWEEGNFLLQKMIAQESGYPSPSLTTYRDLLKYQIIDAQWDEAEKTFIKLLQYYSNTLVTLGEKSGVMIDGFETLSLALGKHSDSLCHYYEEDKRYGRGWLVSPGIQETLFKLQLQSNQSSQLPVVSSFSVSSISKTVETFPNVPHNNISSRIIPGSTLEFVNENRKSMAKTMGTVTEAPIVRDILLANSENLYNLSEKNVFLLDRSSPIDYMEKEDIKNIKRSDVLWQQLPTPSSDAWRFILRMLFITSHFNNIEIPSTVYCEVLRALLMEKEWQACQLLIDWRERSQIHVKSPNNDMEKIIRTETFVHNSIHQFIQTAETFPNPV